MKKYTVKAYGQGGLHLSLSRKDYKIGDEVEILTPQELADITSDNQVEKILADIYNTLKGGSMNQGQDERLAAIEKKLSKLDEIAEDTSTLRILIKSLSAGDKPDSPKKTTPKDESEWDPRKS
jgi:hypothetical protein